jgi:hypothetical protein
MFRASLAQPQEELHDTHVEALSFNKVKVTVKCIKLVRVIKLC